VGESCGRECRAGLGCVAGLCAELKGVGQPCQSSSECAGGGYCVDGACHDLLIDCH
jgi:hypothetical protein